MKTTAVSILLGILTACAPQQQQQQQQQADSNQSGPANQAANEITSSVPANRAVEARPAPKAPPLAEPNGPIDPKSAEAAGQVVQHYGALIEEKRFAEAAALWGDANAAAAFARQLGSRNVHLEIGNLGPTEGAAGSIYTTMPVVFYGEGFRRRAEIVLRRVNDVPGSTEQQRRWHIERIEWKAGG